MKTKSLIMLFGVLLVSLSGCSGVLSGTSTGGRVNHIVLCWLKEPGNIEHRQRIIEVSKSFRDIPEVLEVRAGQVIESDRGIVDDSFDVGICITLGNAEDMNAYLDHPQHRKAVEEVIKPLVEKTVVYDIFE